MARTDKPVETNEQKRMRAQVEKDREDAPHDLKRHANKVVVDRNVVNHLQQAESPFLAVLCKTSTDTPSTASSDHASSSSVAAPPPPSVLVFDTPRFKAPQDESEMSTGEFVRTFVSLFDDTSLPPPVVLEDLLVIEAPPLVIDDPPLVIEASPLVIGLVEQTPEPVVIDLTMTPANIVPLVIDLSNCT